MSLCYVGIVVFIVIQEIAWIINGDWILAIIFPIICPLCLLGIPYGIIKLFIWLGPKEKYETKKTRPRAREKTCRVTTPLYNYPMAIITRL